MKSLLILLCAVPVMTAQQWEVTALGGFAMARGMTIEKGNQSVKAGFKEGLAAGALLGNDSHRRVSGEFRYMYRAGAARLESGSSEFSSSARQHIVGMDLLYHFADRGQKVRPFIAAGGGGRRFEGRGAEMAIQPLQNVAVITSTSQTSPFIDAGAGVKWYVGKKTIFRIEFRDYMGPGPEQVLTPVPGSTMKGWVHDLMGLAGVGFSW